MSSPKPTGAGLAASAAASKAIAAALAAAPRVPYELYAVVVHIGTSAMSGHYVTYSRTSDVLTCDMAHSSSSGGSDATGAGESGDALPDAVQQWHLMNDGVVTRLPESHVLDVTQEGSSHTPYMLYYRRCDLGVCGGSAASQEQAASAGSSNSTGADAGDGDSAGAGAGAGGHDPATPVVSVIPDVAGVLCQLVAAENAAYLQELELEAEAASLVSCCVLAWVLRHDVCALARTDNHNTGLCICGRERHNTAAMTMDQAAGPHLRLRDHFSDLQSLIKVEGLVEARSAWVGGVVEEEEDPFVEVALLKVRSNLIRCSVE